MGIIGNLQFYLFLLLALAAFAVEVWALVHALRQPAQAFTYAGKRTKNFWLIVLAVNVALGFIALPPFGPLSGGFLSIMLIVPAAIYLTDVRPAVSGYGRGRRGGGGW
ncbi:MULTISPECIES: DUF2516 family protein [Georgenia]|uniref:DUF2516 family protein n=1 Tax=Georgenia TaxID=154116 RepID=UPI001E62C4C4|nr:MULTISPECIES: DUF2516 family protein [Georgenia]